jgi:TrmH family RNA methyltransferase
MFPPMPLISIESKQNQQIKHWRKIITQKDKLTSCFVWVEGIHLCQEVLQHQTKYLPHAAIITKSSQEKVEIQRLCQDLASRDMPIFCLSDNIFTSLSTLVHGDGVAIIIEIPTSFLPSPDQDVLLLDGLQDPGNVGTLLRTALACDIKQILLTQGSVSVWNQKVLRAAMGAHFQLNLIEESVVSPEFWQTALQQTPTNKMALVVKDGKALYQTSLVAPTVWMLGNEGSGLSTSYHQLATTNLMIPQKNVESLNVAIAGAVALFEQQRQRLETFEH